MTACSRWNLILMPSLICSPQSEDPDLRRADASLQQKWKAPARLQGPVELGRSFRRQARSPCFYCGPLLLRVLYCTILGNLQRASICIRLYRKYFSLKRLLLSLAWHSFNHIVPPSGVFYQFQISRTNTHLHETIMAESGHPIGIANVSIGS